MINYSLGCGPKQRVYGVIKTETIMTKIATLPSNNEAWGFFGTIRHHADPEQAWPIAFEAIATFTGCADEGVRDFLDSRRGRQFADDVVDGLIHGRSLADATDSAVKRWMAQTIGRSTLRETGIPTRN